MMIEMTIFTQQFDNNRRKYFEKIIKLRKISIRLVKTISEYANLMYSHNEDFYDIFLEWEEEIGFPGREIYACENEYEESEENYDKTI